MNECISYAIRIEAVAGAGDRLAIVDMDQKVGGLLCPSGGPGSPSNTMWPGPRPTAVPSGILIVPTVWPQYTNVTDRQDRQRSDNVGPTILQMVAQVDRRSSGL